MYVNWCVQGLFQGLFQATRADFRQNVLQVTDRPTTLETYGARGVRDYGSGRSEPWSHGLSPNNSIRPVRVDGVGAVVVYSSGMKIFEDMMTLGSVVERVRKQQGATPIELAQMFNVGVRFVRDLEDGKRTIQMDKLMRVLEVLGIALAYDLPPNAEVE